METCRICIDDMLPNERKYTTICNHSFHADCFENWKKTNKYNILKCPNCNRELEIPTFNSELIKKEIDDYIDDWGELNCEDLITQIDKTYSSKFLIDRQLIEAECNKRQQQSGGRRRRRHKSHRQRRRTTRRVRTRRNKQKKKTNRHRKKRRTYIY